MELGEIEHAAATARGCRVTVASVLNQNLVVFCLTDGEATAQTILDACKKWLPSYMMPNTVVLKAELPQLPSGKIDRKRLEAEYLEDSNAAPEHEDEDLDQNEEAARDAVHTTLGSHVTLNTKLNQIGLDSLSAIRVASILRRKGYHISAVEILSAPTLAGLGKILGRCASTESRDISDQPPQNYEHLKSLVSQDPLVREKKDLIQCLLPCTPVQASMLAETKQDGNAYCNWINVEIDSSITISRARDAFLRIVRSNEALRTGFIYSEEVNTGFAQIVFMSALEPLVHAVEEFSYDFSLRTDEDFLQPIRAQVARRADCVELLIHMHHSLYDGWSIDILVNDLNQILASEAEYAPARPQFARVVDFYQAIRPEQQQQSEVYWKSVMREYQPYPLPGLLVNSNGKHGHSDIYHSIPILPETLRSKLPRGCHPQSLFQGALSYLLSCHLGKQDIVFGTVTSGRTLSVTGIEDVFGPCLATLPLRVAIDQDGDCRKLLNNLSSLTTAMLSHSLIPLQQIKTLSNVLPGQPLFDVLFIWQESLQSRSETGHLAKLKDSKDNLEFNVVLEVEPQDRSLAVKLSYKNSLWSAEYASVFLEQFLAIVHQVIENDRQSLAELVYSIPPKNLSPPLSPTTPSLREICSQLSIPQDALLVLARHNGKAYQPVPRGAPGQICWTRSESSFSTRADTEQVFSSLQPTEKFARMLNDTSVALVHMDHATSQTKASQSDLEEIRTSLQSFPHAELALAVLQSDKHGDETLVAFWVPAGLSSSKGSALDLTSKVASLVGRLYDFLLVRLPQHLIPKLLVPVGRIPTADEAATFYSSLSPTYLQSVADAQLQAGHDDEWSELELRIAGAVEKVAGVDSSRVQLKTSFFSLGINSITAIALARALNKRHQLEVEAADLLRNPSVAQLASFLDRQRQTKQAVRLDLESIFSSEFRRDITQRLASQGREVLRIRPCTPNQEALLSASASSAHGAYQNHSLFSIRCDLDLLQNAVYCMFSRHEILRTCFFASDDRRFSFAQVTLSEFKPEVEILSENIKDRLTRNFDAIDTMLPPVSIAIESSEKPQMLLSMHHALYDKQAIDVMLSEIEQLCKGQTLEHAPSFDDFLATSLSVDLDAADKFWTGLLSDYVAAPILHLNQDNDSNSVETISQVLELRQEQLEETARRLEMTLLSVCQAAWASTLSVLADEDDVCFGNAISGRTIDVDGIESLVAPCFNTVPMRVDLSRSRTPEDLVKHLHRINTQSLQHQFTPLRRIQNKWSSDGERLVESMFLLQGHERPLDEDIWTLELDIGDMGIPVLCEVTPHLGSGLVDCTLQFQNQLLSREQATQVLHYFQDCLKWVTGLEASENNTTRIAPDLARRIYQVKEEELKPFQDALGLVSKDSVPQSPSALPSKSALIRSQRQESLSSISGQETTETDHFDTTESTIRGVLASLARVPEEHISKTRTIFQLGLDSISAIQVAKALRYKGYQAHAEDVLSNPTILSLAAFLNQNQATSARRGPAFDFDSFDTSQRAFHLKSLRSDDRDVKSVIPCTAVQAGIIAQFRHNQGALYFNEWIFRCSTEMELDRFISAWHNLIERHDILRTAFVESDSSKHPFTAVCYSTSATDRLGELVQPDIKRRAQVLVHDDAKQSVLDTPNSPPWRVQFTSPDEERYIHFSALHALFDAKVLNILFKDLWTLYEGDVLSLPPPNPKAAASSVLAGAVDEDGQHKQFWTRHLEKASPCKFPNLAPERSTSKELRTSTIISSLSFTKIRQRCRDLGITFQAALQGAYTAILSMYTGDPGVTFGVVLSGRDNPETLDAAFPTAVTLPFYAEWYGKPQDLLRNVMDYNGSVRTHQFSPLTDIHRWLDIGNASLFDCLLVLQEPGRLGNDEFALVHEAGTAEYAISMEVVPTLDDKVEISLIHWDDVLPQQHAGMMLQQFDYMVAELIEFNAVKLADGLWSVQPPECPLLDTDVKYMHEFAEHTIQKHPDKPSQASELDICRARRTSKQSSKSAVGSQDSG